MQYNLTTISEQFYLEISRLGGRGLGLGSVILPNYKSTETR